MTEMTFDGRELKWGSDRWVAVSGPFGKGSLPAGNYAVARRHVVPLTANIKRGFKDPVTGLGFFVPIVPETANGRGGLGIHPDGGTPGTEGCIGLRGNTLTFYQKIKALPLDENPKLIVS